jgi:hypothetical protein
LDSGPAVLHRLPESIAHVAEALWMQALEEGKRRALLEQCDTARIAELDKQRLELRSHVLTFLAGELRRAGGFAKETIPFTELLWADFLRRRMKRKLVEKNFRRALKETLTLAKTDVADYLPGWCGPVTDTAGGRPAPQQHLGVNGVSVGPVPR